MAKQKAILRRLEKDNHRIVQLIHSYVKNSEFKVVRLAKLASDLRVDHNTIFEMLESKDFKPTINTNLNRLNLQDLISKFQNVNMPKRKKAPRIKVKRLRIWTSIVSSPSETNRRKH